MLGTRDESSASLLSVILLSSTEAHAGTPMIGIRVFEIVSTRDLLFSKM